MTQYSVQARDIIFEKGCGFLSFAKNMDNSIGKNIGKNLRDKYSHTLLDYVKQSAADAFKTASKGAIQKTPEATGDLTDNKIADKITKGSKNSQQSNSETVTKENDKEKPKERYISPEKRQEIIDELRLI